LSEQIELHSGDRILEVLNFRAYRMAEERRVTVFLPAPDEPQTKEIVTPWGGLLTATYGDYLVSEADSPDDCWPVEKRIFEETYEIIRPGYCVKRAVILLVPLTAVTGGDEDRMVIVHTLEGAEAARAGDFYLAKGVRGEIWCYPKDKVLNKMRPVE
jgi:hypothetical protein